MLYRAYRAVLLEDDLTVNQRDETFVDASLVTIGSDKVDDCKFIRHCA